MIDTDADFADVVTKINRDAQGRIVVFRDQDVTPYIEANKRAMNEAPSWRPAATTGGYREIADIPMIVVEKWMKEGLNILSNDPDMQRKLYRKLNDGENEYLRTAPGTVGIKTRMW